MDWKIGRGRWACVSSSCRGPGWWSWKNQLQQVNVHSLWTEKCDICELKLPWTCPMSMEKSTSTSKCSFTCCLKYVTCKSQPQQVIIYSDFRNGGPGFALIISASSFCLPLACFEGCLVFRSLDRCVHLSVSLSLQILLKFYFIFTESTHKGDFVFNFIVFLQKKWVN